jgi:hypothetical protein
MEKALRRRGAGPSGVLRVSGQVPVSALVASIALL